MKWISTTNLQNNGLPVTRSIKIPGMESPVFFSTTGKAEVTDAIADLLVNSFDTVFYSDSTNAGNPLPSGQDYMFQDINYNAPDGSYNDLTVDRIHFGEVGPFTGTLASTGDFVLLGTVDLGVYDMVTSSTTYTQPYANKDSVVFPFGDIRDVTGLEDIWVSASGRFNVDEGETLTVRINMRSSQGPLPETELTSEVGANFQRFSTPRGRFTANGAQFFDLQTKVSGGSGTLYGKTYGHVWAELA